MGIPKKHEPVKLIIGLIGKEIQFTRVKKILSGRFGPVDFESQVIEFNFTDYYQAEMGSGLKRKFLCFERRILPETLPEIKLYTNKLEKKFSGPDGKRRVNIDPGYLTLSKLVLATTKDYQHRLYLGRGIYAEVTLRFRKKTFSSWEWTYPDYGSSVYIDIFNHLRSKLWQERQRNNVN